MRRGLSKGRLGSTRASRASRRVGPLYHGRFGDRSSMLAPSNPEIGRKVTFSGLYPIFLTKADVSWTISSKRVWLQLTVLSSILFTATMSWRTPRVKARRTCSRVWPFLLIPASNSPVGDATTNNAASAYEKRKREKKKK